MELLKERETHGMVRFLEVWNADIREIRKKTNYE